MGNTGQKSSSSAVKQRDREWGPRYTGERSLTTGHTAGLEHLIKDSYGPVDASQQNKEECGTGEVVQQGTEGRRGWCPVFWSYGPDSLVWT